MPKNHNIKFVIFFNITTKYNVLTISLLCFFVLKYLPAFIREQIHDSHTRCHTVFYLL
jgi:hypothetical protein